MKVYFIVPKESYLPSDEKLAALKEVAEVESTIHTGKLAEIKQLTENPEEKILALDPDFCDWEPGIENVGTIPNLKAVCASTTSFDWIKPEKLKEMGIVGTNVPGFSSDSVAEFAIAMAIDVSRQLPLVIKEGWKYIGEDHAYLLKGKKLGVVGLGRIGTRVAELGKGIGMEVLYYSPNSSDDRFSKRSLEEIFKDSDVVIPTLVENDETKKIISNDILDSMKSDAVLVGLNRVKDLWDEDYVLEKVKKSTLRGYAFEGDNAKPLPEYEGNILALPPIAWATKDSLDNMTKIWLETIMGVVKGEPINVVT